MNETVDSLISDAKLMSETAFSALEDGKGQQICLLDVRTLTDVTDAMIIATGTSDRHVRALAERVIESMREEGWRYHSMEGEDTREWILIDFVDVVVHVMRDKWRKHYDLESLWDENLGELLPKKRESMA